ncbi:MAG: pseudouridine synthase [Pseudomonadota bacterium]
MACIILFNKPYGVMCQFSPSLRPSGSARNSLRDYLPQRDVYPAGRLDVDSEGLVVLTADGILQHRISDPRHKLAKTYLAEVEGVPSAAALHRLCAGSIDLGDFVTLPAQARGIEPPDWLWPRVPPVRFRKNIPTAWIEITLSEGKNRQVRRMTAVVGHPTLRLIRYRIGEWTIAGLDSGSWRELVVDTPRKRIARPARQRLSTSRQFRR